MPLSPEEQAELAQLEQEEIGLNENEAMELAKLEQEEAAEQAAISPLESSLRGAAQGVTAGFADEISGAVESAFTEKTYEQARDESRLAFKIAQEENPIAFTSGEVAGAIGQGIVAGPSIKAATALGGIAGLGNSEEDEFEGLILDSFLGAGMGSLSHKVGGQLGKGFTKAAKFVGESAENSGNTLIKRSLGIFNKAGNLKLAKKLGVRGDSADDFIRTLEKEVGPDGKTLISPFKSQEDLLSDVLSRKSQLGEEMGSILKQVDAEALEAGVKQTISPREMADNLTRKVLSPLIDSPVQTDATQKLAKKVAREISILENSKYDWSLTDANNWKKQIAGQVNFLKKENKNLQFQDQLKNIVTEANRMIHDKVDSFAVNPKTLSTFKNVKNRWATLNDAESFIEESVADQAEGLSGSIRKSLGLVAFHGGATATGAYLGGTEGAALGMALTVASKSPRTNLIMGKTMKKVGQFLTANPGNKDYIERLTVAASRGNDAWKEELETVKMKIEGFITDPGEADQLRQQTRASKLSPRAQLKAMETINQGIVPDFQEVRKPVFKKAVFKGRNANGRKIQ